MEPIAVTAQESLYLKLCFVFPTADFRTAVRSGRIQARTLKTRDERVEQVCEQDCESLLLQ